MQTLMRSIERNIESATPVGVARSPSGKERA
jgi:hypothetical protein